MKLKIIVISSYFILMKINIFAGCSVTTESLNFGNYKPFDNSDLKTNANIYVSCVSDFNIKPNNNIAKRNVTVLLSTGYSGNYSNRQLVSNGNILYYNLYTNNRRNKIWGNGTNNTYTVTKKIKDNQQKTFKVHGAIPQSQSIPPGIYTDSIIAEISY